MVPQGAAMLPWWLSESGRFLQIPDLVFLSRASERKIIFFGGSAFRSQATLSIYLSIYPSIYKLVYIHV